MWFQGTGYNDQGVIEGLCSFTRDDLGNTGKLETQPRGKEKQWEESKEMGLKRVYRVRELW